MTNPSTALAELRSLVATYLEGSEDAARAAELLAAVEEQLAPTEPVGLSHSTIAEDVARKMFGCTAEAIDGALSGKSRRDVAMYAMGTLSNAQELIRHRGYEGTPEWWVADRDANTIRQFINIAKYAVDKAVPR
jgi:hypothetical protein